jgi:pyruvate dehydrogenase E2 component (dihydrolipoamide acetyltransferase)
MAEIVRMPKLSDTMTEGVVAAWHKNVGEKVKAGDLLAEIETDKATMEFESFQEGVLLHIGVPKGGTAPVDSILAILGKEGEDVSALLTESPKQASAPAPEEPTKSSSAPTPATPAPQVIPSNDSSSDRVKASPLAKSIAKDKGIDLRSIVGSGDGGRIIKKDLDSASSAQSAPGIQFTASNSSHEVSISQMRKTIARRLGESKFTAPHFYLTMDINMDQSVAARNVLKNNMNVAVSFNDMVIKAVALALRKHPAVNSAWLGDKIRFHDYVNIGVAVAVPEGLVVPVIHISAAVKDFAQRAKDKKLQPEEMQGNTFSISNLGMFGISNFTAIINPPDSAILAVGAIRQEPVVRNGQIVVGHTMTVTLSCDHRSVDGATGAAFLQTLKAMLEVPLMMLV